MGYLALTQATANWILAKHSLLESLHSALRDTSGWRELPKCEFVEGPFRVAASSDGEILACWNVDYLSGTGDEPWGFVKIDGKLGLLSDGSISREVLERCLYVINQRLQGLFIDGAFIHRAHPNGAHTCLAGRGTQARQVSIGYAERVLDGITAARAIVCVGPAYDFNQLAAAAATAARDLDSFVETSNALIAPGRKRSVCPPAVLADLRSGVAPYVAVDTDNEYGQVEVATATSSISRRGAFNTLGFSYTDWIAGDSPLSEVQRRILDSNAIERHPLRIVGPGGSGKTLLMQLLALKVLNRARDSNGPVRVLYVVHNAAMANSVGDRFAMLEGQLGLQDETRILDIFTLTDYARTQLQLEHTAVIDTDAHEAKTFQLNQVIAALKTTLAIHANAVADSELFSIVRDNPDLLPIFARLISTEISIAIKGHGLEGDQRRYVQSERRLSRLHGVLTLEERTLVFDVYMRYHAEVFEALGVLDTDDIALSLLGRLRTPIWELKRRELGYDYVFVDETQLFNENERRVLPLLTRPRRDHVPIVLALDEAQDVYAQATAGMSTLGIPDIANENLASIHRSTKAIVRLAFFVIQRSTDLFGPDFPDFTGIAEQMEADTHPLAATPRIEIASQESRSLGRFVVKRIRDLRKANLRQIAVICHADVYWDPLLAELESAELPLYVLQTRGERLAPNDPLVVLTKPMYVGGQEFDAVIIVGLEQGLTPPRVIGNEAFGSAVEQQALREIYLSVTRARYRLIVVLSAGASPSAVVAAAEKAGLLTRTE